MSMLLAIAASLATATLFYPALGLGRTRRLGVLVPLCLVILLTTLIVPPEHKFLRAIAAAFADVQAVKLFDLHVGASLGHRPDLRTFLLFLPNPSSVVLRKLDSEPRPSRRDDLVRLVKASLAAAVAGSIFWGCFQVDWRRLPFAVEHCVKVTAFFLMLVPVSAGTVSAIRLLGGKSRDGMDNPFVAVTPADFWKRYNRIAQQFFHEDIFKPLGGRRAIVRVTLLTFAISAALHEYMFDIAVGRIQGYQTLFFLLQGCAVALTIRARPKGWAKVAWWAGTQAFNLATGVLFFGSINEIMTFYAVRQ